MEQTKSWKDERILGFPVVLFVGMAVIMFILGRMDLVLTNMIGALGYALIVGTMIGWVGDKIPVWSTWFGGGMVLTSLVASAMNQYGLIGPEVLDGIKTFNSKTGFLNLYVLVLITGSVLSIDRNLLVKSFAGYLPTIAGGIFFALLFCGAVGAVTGVGFVNAIADFGLPIMGGGNGAGISPMSKMWAAAKGLGEDAASTWWASAFATISLGNIIAIFASSWLNKLGERFPKLTGNGQLMRSAALNGVKQGESLDSVKIGPGDYACGFALGLFCFCIATFYSKNISIINHLDNGVNIHEFAFMVILVAILNISNVLPVEVRAGARGIQMFFVKYMSFAFMITTGVGSKLSDFMKVFASPANLLCVCVTIVGAMVGTWLIGNIFGLFPVESMLTAGLCMANGGGAGDIMCLGAAKRMDMIPYAQLSTRIGGALTLIVASVFFGKFL